MPEPLKYYCWKCDPQRTFLTAEAKGQHIRRVHGQDAHKAGRPDADLDAYYDADHRMFRPGPKPEPRPTGWFRRWFRNG